MTDTPDSNTAICLNIPDGEPNMTLTKSIVLSIVVFVILLGLSSCDHTRDRSGAGEPVVLNFSFTVDEEICRQNKYKRTPQFAIWVENAQTGEIRTVCVTAKTATGKWGGKTTRPVSLPWWVSRWNVETGRHGDPTADQSAADAVTCATPQAKFERQIALPRGGRWRCFIEVNVSGDHNEHYPEKTADGRRDVHSNGQPSIVYCGEIRALGGKTARPVVLGRTDQFEATKDLSEDLSGITTAAQLLCDITIACRD